MKEQTPPCKFCRQRRLVLASAALIFVLISIQPQATFLVGVDLTKIFAWLLGSLLVLVVVWKAYNEFWK